MHTQHDWTIYMFELQGGYRQFGCRAQGCCSENPIHNKKILE